MNKLARSTNVGAKQTHNSLPPIVNLSRVMPVQFNFSGAKGKASLVEAVNTAPVPVGCPEGLGSAYVMVYAVNFGPSWLKCLHRTIQKSEDVLQKTTYILKDAQSYKH